MTILFNLILPMTLVLQAYPAISIAADKTQAWGGHLNSSHSGTMRNRNQNAKAWIGEQARGWGQGSRLTNTLTTSTTFHLQSSQKAIETINSNTSQVNSLSVSACGTCTTFQNSGNTYSITNSSVSSVNSGSITSASIFNN